jgi:hypothetical protein
VTAETVDRASPGEASFQLLAEHLPDLVIFAFDAELRMVLCRDVTGQRRAEELVRASQRQLADARRIAQIGSWNGTWPATSWPSRTSSAGCSACPSASS